MSSRLCIRCGLEFVRRSNSNRRTVCYREACQVCAVSGCGRPRATAGYCRRHAARALRHGDPSGGGIERDHYRPAFCDVGGCDEPTARRFLCSAHYQRFKDHGHPLGFIRKHGGIAPTCLWSVCDEPAESYGRCDAHYRQTPIGQATALRARDKRRGAEMPGQTTPEHLAGELERGVCGICELEILEGQTTEWDHIQPWSRGGRTNDANIQLAHASCNRSKGAKVAA